MALVFCIGGAGAQRNSPNTCVIIQALDHEGLATYPERTDYFVMRLLVTMRGRRVLRRQCRANWRSRLGLLLLALPGVLPSVMTGQAGSGAMLAARGNVAVNGRVVGTSQALLPGDLTVTQKESGGNLTQNGTNAMLGPETALRYEGEYAVLERGGVSANTQSGFAVQAGCWTVKPQMWNQWTQFAISYANAGEVLIQARGGDVRVYGRMQKARDKKSDKTAEAGSGDRNRDVNGAPVGTSSGTQ